MHRSARALARYCHTDEESLQAYLPRLHALVTLQDFINGIHALAPTKLGMFGTRQRSGGPASATTAMALPIVSARVWWRRLRSRVAGASSDLAGQRRS